MRKIDELCNTVAMAALAEKNNGQVPEFFIFSDALHWM